MCLPGGKQHHLHTYNKKQNIYLDLRDKNRFLDLDKQIPFPG